MALDPAVMALFSEAFDQIERVAAIGRDGEDLSSAFVYSGGHFSEMQKNIPAIHLTPEAAVKDWQAVAAGWLTGEAAETFRFSEVPKLEKLVMTETDDLGCQRLTATRYGVTSRLAVLTRWSGPAAVAEPSRPAKKRQKPKPSTKAKRPANRRKR